MRIASDNNRQYEYSKNAERYRSKYQKCLNAMKEFKSDNIYLYEIELTNQKLRISNYQEQKNRDHCHFTGKFRGAAHRSCNINFNYKNWKIPVIMHNFKGYDSHFIVAAINKKIKSVNCISTNKEKLMTIIFEIEIH